MEIKVPILSCKKTIYRSSAYAKCEWWCNLSLRCIYFVCRRRPKFILNKLNFLEKENGLRICIHCRDFIPGTDIADNITNAIHTSRRTVCVLTPYFLDSYWCMYELNMARMETIYSRKGQNILCLIILNKDVFRKVPFKFLDLLENQSYLEYPDNDNDHVLFWDKLCETLKSRPQ